MPECNPHPDAPHGFNRSASHSEDRYVCDCEVWDPDYDWEPDCHCDEYEEDDDDVEEE